MARKKQHDKEPNHERWLVSYGDLLTLLFAVFVVLYAMSQSDVKKAKEAADSMREAFGIIDKGGASRKPSVIGAGSAGIIPQPEVSLPPPLPAPGKGRKPQATDSDLRGMKASLDAYLTKIGAKDRVSVTVNQRGLVVSLREAGFFDSGSAVLKEGASEVVETIASFVRENTNRCRVEGHTDNVPIRTASFSSNWDLSTARATSLVKRLVERYGVDPRSISAAGYGKYQPVADNATAEGRAQNRRVDVVILSPTSGAGEPQTSADVRIQQ
jgi:chemotaxis protein MotB